MHNCPKFCDIRPFNITLCYLHWGWIAHCTYVNFISAAVQGQCISTLSHWDHIPTLNRPSAYNQIMSCSSKKTPTEGATRSHGCCRADEGYGRKRKTARKLFPALSHFNGYRSRKIGKKLTHILYLGTHCRGSGGLCESAQQTQSF